MGYVDSDWGSNTDDRQSVCGYVVMYGQTAVTWASMMQKSIALSSIQAEYMAASMGAREATWIGNLLRNAFEKSLGIAL